MLNVAIVSNFLHPRLPTSRRVQLSNAVMNIHDTRHLQYCLSFVWNLWYRGAWLHSKKDVLYS